MQFKERNHKYKNWQGNTAVRPQAQCPVCGEWFDQYSGRNARNVKHHITLLAKEEIFLFMLGATKSIKHFTFYKNNTVRVGRTKNIWKR